MPGELEYPNRVQIREFIFYAIGKRNHKRDPWLESLDTFFFDLCVFA